MNNEIHVELSEEEIQSLIGLYLKDTVTPESFSVFTDIVATDHSLFKKAVYDTVVNESIVSCLAKAIPTIISEVDELT